MLAVTFVLFLSVTLFVPSFPPAQLLHQYLGIQQLTLSFWGISAATLLIGITNGFFWTIIFAALYGLGRLVLHAGRLRPLKPLPAPPVFAAPPIEAHPVGSGTDIIPPALTISPESPSPAVRNEPVRHRIEAAPVSMKSSREILGGDVAIEIIDGIGPVFGYYLRNLGVETVSDLLKVGATERGRLRIAREVGVGSDTVLKWVYRGDLLRVKGVGAKYSALLESAGINSVKDLSCKNPHYLCQTLKAVNREMNLVDRPPPAKTVEMWVYNAKALEPVLVVG